MAENDFIWRFTPSRTDPELLEEIFVQRQAMLANIVERVRESALTRNKHQILLIGPRDWQDAPHRAAVPPDHAGPHALG